MQTYDEYVLRSASGGRLIISVIIDTASGLAWARCCPARNSEWWRA